MQGQVWFTVQKTIIPSSVYMKGFKTFYAKSGWYKMFPTEDRVQEKSN